MKGSPVDFPEHGHSPQLGSETYAESAQTEKLVALLRNQSAKLEARQCQAVWQRVAARTEMRPSWLQTLRDTLPSLWVRNAMWACAASIVLIVSIKFSLSRKQMQVAQNTQAHSIVAPAVAHTQWQLSASSHTKWSGPSDAPTKIEVAEGGRAIVASADEVMILDEKTTLAFDRGQSRRAHLVQGRVWVETLSSGQDDELELQGRGWSLRPLGTAYRVDARAAAPVVHVTRGRVALAQRDSRTTIERGQEVRDSSVQPMKDSAVEAMNEELRLAREIAAADAQTGRGQLRIETAIRGSIQIDGFNLGEGYVEAWLSQGQHEITLVKDSGVVVMSRTVDVKDGENHLITLKAKSVVHQPKTNAEPPADVVVKAPKPTVEMVERFLAAGKTEQARATAAEILSDVEQKNSAPVVHTLVAESYTRDRKFSLALRAYSDLQQQYPRSRYGEQALFMMASLELEQLQKPANAAQTFALYLKTYPRSTHREHAYLLRCRALQQLGNKTPEVQRTASAYLAEFPRGQYVDKMRRLVK